MCLIFWGRLFRTTNKLELPVLVLGLAYPDIAALVRVGGFLGDPNGELPVNLGVVQTALDRQFKAFTPRFTHRDQDAGRIHIHLHEVPTLLQNIQKNFVRKQSLLVQFKPDYLKW